MTYILTCGCESQYGGFPSEWDAETKECEPAIAYGCLCDKHFAEYDARPAQYAPRELSDEEIEEVEQQVDKKYAEELIYRQNEWVYLFARAILKKASNV